jgi:hypothetical protein
MVRKHWTQSYTSSIVGIPSILKEAWTTAQNREADKRVKIQALSLAKEYYSVKLDLLTNATVVNDAIKFVSSNNNKKSVVALCNHKIICCVVFN